MISIQDIQTGKVLQAKDGPARALLVVSHWYPRLKPRCVSRSVKKEGFQW